MKQSFAHRLAVITSVASLASGCRGCKESPALPDAGPSIVLKSEVMTEIRWVLAPVVRLREAPDAGAPVVTKVTIGTQVLLIKSSEAGWSQVLTIDGEGWLTSDLLATEPLTLNRILAQYDAVPADNIAERRVWAERAVAFAPKDIDALERLLAVLNKAENPRRYEQIQKSLAALHEVPAANRVAVVIEDDTPLVASVGGSLVRTLLSGDMVALTGEPNDSGWAPVKVLGRQGWVHGDRLLPLSDVRATSSDTDASDPSVEPDPARDQKIAILLGAEFQGRLSRNPSVHSRRAAARHLLRFIADRAAAGQAREADVALLWRRFHDDGDGEVRRIADEEVLVSERIATSAPFHEQLRQLIGQLAPGVDESERQRLAAIVRKSNVPDAQDLLAALATADAGSPDPEDAGVQGERSADAGSPPTPPAEEPPSTREASDAGEVTVEEPPAEESQPDSK